MTHTYRDASRIYSPMILCHYLLKNSIYLFGDEKRKKLPNPRNKELCRWRRGMFFIPPTISKVFGKLIPFTQLDILVGI